ncbi:alpha/beta hydrolase [Thiohalocapsa sp.]|uniref:alpha/beta fold hydrolase n=1 Tax=Thiohalocapsa sp. TaxID=2497641 RepID=UPI0025E656C6|nr:alpha/beta hydrolase [Thiohalocapsa sp.]
MSPGCSIRPLKSTTASAVIRNLLNGLPEQEVMLAGHPRTGSDHRFVRSYRSFRERFQALTGLGLSHRGTAQDRPQRLRIPGRGDLPDLSYLAAGSPKGRQMLFIHGTPGTAHDWTPFLHKGTEGQYRLAVDRPGFGESGPGAPVVALGEQARAIAALLQRGEGPAVLVGSSYGGPVALRLAADHPGLVAGVLLVGAAGDPECEQTHLLQRLAAARPFRRLLPRALAHSNAELLALRRELQVLGEHMGRIQAPVMILQGLHDTLVPAENSAYLAGRLVGTARRRLVYVEQAGHFLHILFTDLVEEALRRVLADADVYAQQPEGAFNS